MAAHLCFAEFSFDPTSGMLVRTESQADDQGKTSAVRLPPQPAQLLQLLLENAPEIVSRRQIQQALWPDVQVDFERSLHFCIRQIRSALGESAAEPRFIGTVPRRGYQWLTEVRIQQAAPGISSEIVVPRVPQSRLVAAALLMIIALVCGLGYFSAAAPAPATETSAQHVAAPTRVAVMSFEDPAARTGLLSQNVIAELLVDELTSQGLTNFEVVGPTTTERYADQATPLTSLTEDHNIDVILNGRIVVREGQTSLLGEVIRGSDGAHVWTKMFRGEELNALDAEQHVFQAMLAGLESARVQGLLPQRSHATLTPQAAGARAQQ